MSTHAGSTTYTRNRGFHRFDGIRVVDPSADRRRCAGDAAIQEYLRSELIAAATRLTVDELIERSRQQSATSAVDVQEILDAVHADRR